MIIEIVTFDLPARLTEAEARALYEKSVPQWRGYPNLIRKDYLFDPENMVGGGVYLWQSRADAQAAHDAAWQAKAAELYGSPPRFAYFTHMMSVENSSP